MQLVSATEKFVMKFEGCLGCCSLHSGRDEQKAGYLVLFGDHLLADSTNLT